MNIIEAYIKYNKKLIILLSGLYYEKLLEYAKILSQDLDLPIVDVKQITGKDYYVKLDDKDLEKLKPELKKNKFILISFIPPNLKIDFHYNIKSDLELFKQKNIPNSFEIIKLYKNFLSKFKVNKFIKFNENSEILIDEIFNSLMNLIQINLDELTTIFQ